MIFNVKFALLTFLTVAAAQSSGSASASGSGASASASVTGGSSASASGSAPSGVPSGLGITPCILTCVTNAAKTGGCSSFADLSCVCTSQAFQSAATDCLKNTCTADELNTAVGLQQSQCASIASGSGAASTGAATSGAASGSGSSATRTAPASTGAATTGSQTAAATTSNAAIGSAAGGVWALAAGLLGVAAAL